MHCDTATASPAVTILPTPSVQLHKRTYAEISTDTSTTHNTLESATQQPPQKKARANYSTAEVAELQALFDHNPSTPVASVLENLRARHGSVNTVEQYKNWFKNRRAKAARSTKTSSVRQHFYLIEHVD